VFRLLRWLFSLALFAVFVWFAVTVPLGKRTLWGHLRAIAATDEAKDLAEGAKEEAKKVADKLREGVAPDKAEDKPEEKPDGKPTEPVKSK
jgi:hypothetical protein